MAGVEVPDINHIMAPGGATLGLKDFSKISEPNLFADGFGDGFAF